MRFIASIRKILLAALLAAALDDGLRAGSAPAAVTAPSAGQGSTAAPSLDDRIWGLATIYRNRENPVIEELSLAGDFFLQWAYGSSNRGSYDSGDLPDANRWGDTDVRIWRLGFRSQWFHSFRLNTIINVNPGWDPFYRDFFDVSLTYAPNEHFNLGAGKQKGRFFTQEYRIPTRELIVFDQSLLVNAMVPRGVTGAWVNGDLGRWTYALAGYAGDYQREFSRFNAGAVVQANLGYDFAEPLGLDQAVVRLDYQGSTSGDNSFGPGKFSNAFSLNTTVEQGRFYGYTDFLGGMGRGSQGDVWGVTLTPTYYLIEKTLQLVLRYQYAHGDNDGLKLPRYEVLAPEIQDTKGVGSDYHAVYLGVNYYLYGHKLKLMTGLEHNNLEGGKKDFSGWTYLAGVRLAF